MKPMVVKLEKDSITSRYTPAKKNLLSPIQIVVISYIVVIIIGAFLLAQPFASKSHQPTALIDSLFTSTSAVAVTGLVVKDTGTHWSIIGKLIILVLIQVGGLGYITIFTFFILIIRRKLTLKQGLLLKESFDNPIIKEIAGLAKHIFFTVVLFEGIGAIILFLRILNPLKTSNLTMHNIINSIWFGVFHSVAAFNNAGFDLTGDFKSLTGYVSDPIINFTITILIIAGGLGFYLFSDMHKIYHNKEKRLSFHSKMVIFSTIILIVMGTALLFVFEYNNQKTLGQLSLPTKVMASYFQSVTSRTGGFNTISIGDLTTPSLLIIIILMFIGASPGGTGGGIKTTTITLVYYYIVSIVKRKHDAEIGNRMIPYEIINKAIAIFMISISFVFIMAMIISIFEPFDYLAILFEVTSAFGTVGLSTGITPSLSFISKLLISLTMFAGRAGLLSLILSFSRGLRQGKVILPKEDLTVG